MQPLLPQDQITMNFYVKVSSAHTVSCDHPDCIGHETLYSGSSKVDAMQIVNAHRNNHYIIDAGKNKVNHKANNHTPDHDKKES